MKRSYNGTYTIEQDHYTLAIMYTYYSDDGDYFNPPEEDFEIYEIEYNGMDITDFFWDYLDGSGLWYDALEYARDRAE
jgi:hypothetical protein